MTPGIFPTVMEMCRGETETAEICGHPNLGVTAREWATFTLGVRGHNRPITSFSVILGQVERAQIGWGEFDHCEHFYYFIFNHSNNFTFQPQPVRTGHFVKKLRRGDHKGVGEEQYTVGLDCCRGGILYEGSFTKIDGLNIEKGAVIRVENKGATWLVNGQLVASSIALDETFQLPPDLQQYNLTPAFSGKGSWRICEVELDSLASEHKPSISQNHI